VDNFSEDLEVSTSTFDLLVFDSFNYDNSTNDNGVGRYYRVDGDLKMLVVNINIY